MTILARRTSLSNPFRHPANQRSPLSRLKSSAGPSPWLTGPILDLGKQGRLNPNTSVSNLLRERMRFAHERLESRLQIPLPMSIEAVVDLADINQFFSLLTRQIEPIEEAFLHREARNRQSFELSAGHLDPVVAPVGPLGAISDL